jgi:hypothetical protein
MPDTEVPDCIDIREAVYLRMAPPEIRDEVRTQGAVTDQIEAKIFARTFSAITEEAIFWYQAGQGRGIVLCEGASIRYVRQQSLSQVLQTKDLSRAELNLANYDPNREVVIAVVRGEFFGIALAGPGSIDPVLQLMQS